MSIGKACKLLGYAKQTFFKVRNSRIAKEKESERIAAYILEKVSNIRKEMPRLGGKKLYYLINKDPNRKNYKFGERKFFKVLKAHNLLVIRKKRRAITTDSKLWKGQYPDLVKELIPSRPEQVWVADITYFRTKDGFIYGHLITDGYSKKLVGFEISDNMKAASTLSALKKAVANRIYDKELIHHSDRGFQYLSRVYTTFLKKHKIKISVTQDGSPYDNAVAERINGILKDEFGFGGVFESLEQAKELLEKVAIIYNDKRPHISNHYLTPNEMHQQSKLKIKTWKRDD